MISNPGGGTSADLIALLRSSPIFTTLGEEALGTIASLVASETRERVVTALRTIDLFDGVSDADLHRVAEISVPVTLDADATLFDRGDPGDRCYVVVNGAIRLTRDGAVGGARHEVFRSGKAFGQEALLSDAPRTVRARSVEPSYLVALPRDAFLDLLGIDSVAVRILRNLSRARRPTSSSTAGGAAEPREAERTGREALTAYSRTVRDRLLPRRMPPVTGYDVSGATLADERTVGTAAWDWLPLSDGRIAVVLLKADQPSVSSAHWLLAVRGLLRDFAQDPVRGPGDLLSRVNRGMRAAWVDEVSGSVSCGLMLLSGDSVDWASAGGIAGTIVRADGRRGDEFLPEAVSLGLFNDVRYRQMKIRLGLGDHLLVFSDGPADAMVEGRKFLAAGGRPGDHAACLDALVRRVKDVAASPAGRFDVSAALLTRRVARSGTDALPHTAAVYRAAVEE